MSKDTDDRQLAEPTTNKAAKPIWNTLEVAKLVMSALTPIMIFAVGAYLSKLTTEQGVAREEQVRNEAQTLQKTLRDEADRRDEQIRRANQVRDDAIRADTQRRDDAIRTEGIRRQISDKISQERLADITSAIQKRAAIWDTLGPKISDLEDAFLILRNRILTIPTLTDLNSVKKLKMCSANWLYMLHIFPMIS
jgi:hypothetical protein